MTRNKWNVIVDVLAFVAMVGLASTGLMLAYRLPPGYHQKGILGMGRHGWGDIHLYFAFALMGLSILHLVLHWGWMLRSIGKIALIVLAVAAVAATVSPWCLPLSDVRSGGCGEGRQRGKQAVGACSEGEGADCSSCAEKDASTGKGKDSPGKGQGQGKGNGRGGSQMLHGRTTLAEAAGAAGVPVSVLLKELGLPVDTPPSDELRAHGFRQEKMSEARAAIERLKMSTKATTPTKETK